LPLEAGQSCPALAGPTTGRPARSANSVGVAKTRNLQQALPGNVRVRRARHESMSINSNYLFVVNMDVDADKEALFNEIYDNGNCPG
jgi:hypothetical protein